jgi:hypothetical protein
MVMTLCANQEYYLFSDMTASADPETEQSDNLDQQNVESQADQQEAPAKDQEQQQSSEQVIL